MTGDALSPVYTAFNGTAEVEGFTADHAKGQLSTEVTAGETSTVYFTVAHWDGSTAKPTFYWESGGKYFSDQSGAVGTEAELEESSKPQYSVFYRSKDDAEIVLFGKKDDKECFFLPEKVGGHGLLHRDRSRSGGKAADRRRRISLSNPDACFL